MLTFFDHRLRRLHWQLTLIFLVGFLGIGIAIGLPVIVLISRQASTQAQLLLEQSKIASGAFIEGEHADLQSLALLISQRPTLTQLLREEDNSALASYLDTLRTSADLDLILICLNGEEIVGVNQDRSGTALCQQASSSGFTAVSSSTPLYLYATGEVSSTGLPPYTVLIAQDTASLLSQLQEETGLVYFLVWQRQVVQSRESTVEVTPDLAMELLRDAGQDVNQRLEQRASRINEHDYILSSQEIDPTLKLNLVSALNVDNQIAVQQSLSSTLIFGLVFILLIASALGIGLAQRISQPIARLASAAAKFRQGNLASPISVQSSVWEINQLANTLEDGRVALGHSLQQLQAEKAWIEHLLNSIVEGMLTLDNEDRITFASAGISKITGVEPGQLMGQKIDDVFLPLDGDVQFSHQLPAIGQQRRISVRLENGQERLLSISKSKLVPPEASSANRALVIRDVSNEEYIHRLLGDFMANITHEFRTPLAALEASSELMLENLDNLAPAELEELLRSLNLGITDLQTLIDNLIEAASIEAGRFKISLQPVSLKTIVQEAVGGIQPLAEKYSLRLVTQPIDEFIVVMADQRRTVQALVNLLSNAVKHSPENGTIQVKYAIAAKHLRVEVIDAGSGVPAGQRDNLFRRFAHLDTANERARQGAGLGLSVVKEIVEAQQGEVGIQELGGGTCFWFTIPLIAEGVQE